MRLFIRLLLPVIVLAVTNLLGADDLAPVYAKIDEAAAGFKGLTANIRRVTHMDVINVDDIENGKVVVKRPKPHDIRMLLDVTDPKPKKYAFAGTKAEIYYPNTNTIEEYELGKHKDMVEQFLLLGFGSTSRELRNAYNIRLEGQEKIDGQPTARIELIPKSSDVAQTFPKIELWISNATGLALQQKLYEKGGKDYQLFTYSGMQTKTDIPESDVRLNPPKGVIRTKPPIK